MDATGEQPLKPGPRRRGRRIALLVTALFVGLVCYQLLKPEPPVIEAETPDGKYIVRFIAAGVGKIDYQPDSELYVWFHKQARSYLPVVLFRRLPWPRNLVRKGDPTRTGAEPLMLYFDVRPKVAGVSANPTIFHETSLAFDEPNGFERITSWTKMTQGPGYVVSIEDFPRHDRHLSLRLIDVRSTETFMTINFEVDPPPIPKSSWITRPMPLEQHSNELSCTLKRILANGPTGGTNETEFEIKALSPDWVEHHRSTTFEDSSGNWSISPLSPFEAAWRITLKVHRTIYGEFSESEKWQSPPLKIPDANAASTIDAAGQIGGSPVRLLGAKGPGLGMIQLVEGRWVFSARPVAPSVDIPAPAGGKGRISYNISMPMTERPFVLLDLDGLPAEDHLFVLIRDQDGDVLRKVEDPPTRFANTKCRAAIEFTPRETTKEVTATVIISRPQTFQFDVEPPAKLRAKYAKASGK